MTAPWTPMRWPASWKDPSALDLLKGAAIDYLVVDKESGFDAVRAQARAQGVHVVDAGSTPSGVTLIQGAWPGVKMGRAGGNAFAGGPTGVPWVDTNGWQIRLSAALHPESAVWVDAPPKGSQRFAPTSYLTALADSAAYGGRWLISLDDRLVSGLAARQPDALEAWKTITAAAGFFSSRKAWSEFVPVAAVGIVSDFAGPNESFSRELLNLVGRAGQHYRVLPKSNVAGASFDGLRAVIYADQAPPTAETRKHILAFVESGGLLITVPAWGAVSGAPVKGEEHPRFVVHAAGKGRIAQANAAPDDPFIMASDAVVLVSHRYDLVRFWNGGATGSYYAEAPDRKRAVVHLLFYANRGPDSASVRIAGRYRTAKASTVDMAEIANVHVESHEDAMEVHLPQVSPYVALELEVQ
jgi:hypothetical protein